MDKVDRLLLVLLFVFDSDAVGVETANYHSDFDVEIGIETGSCCFDFVTETEMEIGSKNCQHQVSSVDFQCNAEIEIVDDSESEMIQVELREFFELIQHFYIQQEDPQV